MKLDPIGTRVAVKLEEVQTKTASGIIIPNAGQKKPTVGEIVAVNDETRDDFDVDVGTKILFDKFSGTEVEVDGESLLILEMDSALAILRSEEE